MRSPDRRSGPRATTAPGHTRQKTARSPEATGSLTPLPGLAVRRHGQPRSFPINEATSHIGHEPHIPAVPTDTEPPGGVREPVAMGEQSEESSHA